MKLAVEEGITYDAEKRNMALRLESDSETKIVQDGYRVIGISRRRSEESTTFVRTRKRRLPDVRIEREVLKTEFFRCLAENTDE